MRISISDHEPDAFTTVLAVTLHGLLFCVDVTPLRSERSGQDRDHNPADDCNARNEIAGPHAGRAQRQSIASSAAAATQQQAHTKAAQSTLRTRTTSPQINILNPHWTPQQTIYFGTALFDELAHFIRFHL
jgi:hypothetical protein